MRVGWILLLAGCAHRAPERELPDIVGVWETMAWLDYSCLEVTASGEVRWYTTGCLDRASGTSHGRFDGRRLVLEPPAEQYPGIEIRACVLARLGDREYLFPEDWAADEIGEWRTWPDGYHGGLRRRQPRRLLEARIAVARDWDSRRELLDEWLHWPADLHSLSYLEALVRDEADPELREWVEWALDAIAEKSEFEAAPEDVRRAATELSTRLEREDDASE